MERISNSSPPAFDVAPYRIETAYDLRGLAVVVMWGVFSGIITGLILGWIAERIYIPVLFPAIGGWIVGRFVSTGVNQTKFRNPMLAFSAGAIGGSVMIVTKYLFAFGLFLTKLRPADPPSLWQILSSWSDFWQYMYASAEVSRLGFIGSNIYWLVNLGAGAIAAGLFPAKSARAPACVQCNSWKTCEDLGSFHVPRKHVGDAINSGEVLQLAKDYLCSNTGRLNLLVRFCPSCKESGPVEISFSELVLNRHGLPINKANDFVTYPGEAFTMLLEYKEAHELTPSIENYELSNPRKLGEGFSVELTPCYGRNKKRLWSLKFYAEMALLLDPYDEVVAHIPQTESKGRFVTPGNTIYLGILADSGEVIWFRPKKKLILHIKHFKKGDLVFD